MTSLKNIAVLIENPLNEPKLRAVSAHLGLPLLSTPANDYIGYLLLIDEFLALKIVRPEALGPVWLDFVGGPMGYRRLAQEGVKQPLARAIGLKANLRPTVLDVTAGLGRDSFVLANLGCQVSLVERSPVVAALLNDALQRAAADPETQDVIARMNLVCEDSIHFLANTDMSAVDVIYLDPMYPHRQKSALVKQEMRALRAIVGDDVDAAQLLQVALARKVKRVVVKRPAVAEPLLVDRKPSHSIDSKTTRYDVYLHY